MKPEEQLTEALRDERHPYHQLARALAFAFFQSAVGKGVERHAGVGQRFEEQQIVRDPLLAQGIGGVGFQVRKKVLEAERATARGEGALARRELLGAIVYAAAAHYVTEQLCPVDARLNTLVPEAEAAMDGSGKTYQVP